MINGIVHAQLELLETFLAEAFLTLRHALALLIAKLALQLLAWPSVHSHRRRLKQVSACQVHPKVQRLVAQRLEQFRLVESFLELYK